ncbi:hypothetical protein ACVXHA_25285 [Escherichia coli]
MPVPALLSRLQFSTEYGMSLQITIYRSVNKRTASSPFRYCRAISVYDENNRLFVTSNFHLIPHQCSSAATCRFLAAHCHS